MAEKKAQMSELLEKVLRKDPEKTRRGQEVSKFLAERAAERTAKMGETTGVGDILTLLPGYTGLKALKAGQKGLAALDAAQFLNQFNTGKTGSDIDNTLAALYLARGTTGSLKNIGKLLSDPELGGRFLGNAALQGAVMGSAGMAARKLMGEEDGPRKNEETAAFPQFGGVGKIGNLRRAVERLNLKGKDLPMFSYEGLMAPRRQQELEHRMKEWIPNLSAKDPQKQLAQLDEWLAPQRKLWGKEPISKGQLLDIMPKELRPAFYQSLKDMGYGGTTTGQREVISQAAQDLSRKSGSRVLGSTPGAVLRGEMPSNASRKWEDILNFEQTGGRPKGWSENFPGRDPEWIARPGETLKPGQTPFNWKDAAAGGAAGGLMAIAGMPEEGEADQKAGLVLSPKNLPRLAQMARENIAKLNATRPGPSANYAEGLFAAKYPKIYETMTKGGPVFWDPKTDIGNGYFSLRKGRVGAGTAFPENFTKQDFHDIPSKYFKTLAHEGTHAVDAARFGRVNDIVTKKPLSLADWVEKKDDYLKQRLQDPRYQNPELRKYLTEEGYIQNAKEDAKALDKMSRVFGDAAKNPGMAAFEREVLPDPANFSGNYRSGRVDYRDYRNNPIERRAFKAGETGSQTLNTLATLLDDPVFARQYFRRFGPKPKTMTAGQMPEILGAGAAGLVGASLASEDGQDQQAAVPRMVKLQRALAMARDAKAWAPREAPVFRTPEGDFPRFKDGKLLGSRTSAPEVGFQRSENLADIGPAELQRRGGSYAYGAVDPQGRARILTGPSMYEYTGPNDATDVLKPQSEGGNRTVRGTLKVTNPLIVPSNSFFGFEAPELVQGSGFHMRKPRGFPKAYAFKTPKADTLKNTTSLEEFNSLLPKNLRINNNEWRNFSNNPNRDFSGASDTIGDLLLTKYARRHGYDAILAKRAYRQGARGNTWTDEMVLPSESRHQPLSKYTASAKTLLEAAQNRPDANAKIDLLRARLGTNKPMAIGAGQSPLDQLTNLTSNAQSALSPTSPAAAANWLDDLFPNLKPGAPPLPVNNHMTKEERIKLFGNPGVKKDALIYFEPHDFMSQKILPKKSYMGTQANPDFTILRGKTGAPEMITDDLLKKSPEKFLEIKEKYGLKAYGGYDDPYWPLGVPKPTGDLLDKLKKAGVVF